MSNHTGHRKEDLDEIDLKDLLENIWSKKFFIASVTSIFAVSSIIVSLMITPEYRSSASLVAATKTDVSNISSNALAQLGGIASSFGIDVGGGAADESQIAYDIMQSWGFIEEFINKNNLAPYISAVKGWDSSDDKLIFDRSAYNPEKAEWVSSEPSSYQLFLKFNNKIAISQEKLTGIIKIDLNYYSPKLAKEFLELYVKSINDHMRNRKLNEVNKYVEYLENQISKTSISGMREILNRVIEEQIKTKMLAESSPEYAFIIVNKPMIAENRFKPRRSLIVILSTLAGLFLSVIYVLLKQRLYPKN